ncbi:MAG: DUF1573 domain-containing protein [Bacteroidaceae bacterium]|nr:DUF1573 domain-containing protein [Bacteroidaceae bacterium]MBQ5909623.1 DUF1573 domain-containing protein [Bacteroidaceae bacterium]
MKLRTSLLTAALCLSSAAIAQPQAYFDMTTHDMGTLTWKIPALATFHITNRGSENLLIREVHPDCGCTAVAWTHDPIRPGEKGTISATYDAAMLGHFSKHIAVYTNASERPVFLQLNGAVVLERKEYSGDFPVRIGEIYLDTDVIEFDDITRGEAPVRTISVFNGGKSSYTPQLMHLPKYITATSDPETIRPGRVGTISLTLNSQMLREMGLTQADIYLSRFPGDRVQKDNEINISATLLPEPDASQPLEYAPIAHLSSDTIHLGKMGNRKKLSGTLTLTNTGRSPLVIRTLQVYNPGISVSIGSRRIAPGESEKLKITINANSNYFKGRRRILLITNDPRHPKQIIDVKVEK